MKAETRRGIALAAICLSVTMTSLDGSILNVALPTLVKELGASTSDLQWIVDSYILVFAGLQLATGALGDRYGRRRILMTGLVIFGIASTGAALSSSIGEVVLWRAALGVGAACMLPSSLSIITDLYREQKERARAIGIWAGIGSIGAISGPIVGGILLAHFWWGSVFLVNVPIVVIALVLAMIFVPASNDPAQARLDSLGAVLSIIGLSMLVWTIIEAPSKPLTNTVLTGGVTAVVFLSFVLWERHTPRPMLDLTLFKSPRFTVASMAITTSLFSVAGMTFLLAQYLQNVQGFSPVEAAIHFAPWAITFLFLSPLSPRVAERFGLKRMVVIGIATQALGMALLSQIGADTPYLFLVGALLVMAIGGSAAMPPATDAVMGSVPRERAGMASAVSGTTRQMGSALGVAIMGSALAAGYAASLGDLPSQLGLTGAQRSAAEGSLGGATSVAHAIGGSQGDHLASSAQDAFLHGMHLAVLLSAVLLFAVSMLALRYLPRDERADDYTVEEMALTPDFLSGGEAVIPVVFADAAQDDVEPPRRR